MSGGRIGLDDLGNLFLAAAVGAGDQHRQVRACDLTGEGDGALAGRIGEHRAAQIVALGQLLAAAPFAFAPTFQLAACFGQFQQVVDRGQQLGVVPGFGDVIGRAGLDQAHRAAQMRPGGEQDHGQVRMTLTQLGKQRLAFFAGGGIGGEVHVLDHQIERLLVQQRQPGLRRMRVPRLDVVQRKQHLQCSGHGRVVVDDQDVRHRIAQGGAGVIGTEYWQHAATTRRSAGVRQIVERQRRRTQAAGRMVHRPCAGTMLVMEPRAATAVCTWPLSRSDAPAHHRA